MDSQGRLFVADRSNNRVQVFDQEGKYLTETKAFGRPSGVYIDKNDTLFVADSESQSRDANAYGYNPGVKRGIRLGSAKTLHGHRLHSRSIRGRRRDHGRRRRGGGQERRRVRRGSRSSRAEAVRQAVGGMCDVLT